MTAVITLFMFAVPLLLVNDLAAHRDTGVIPLRSAALWSAFYVGVGLVFSLITFLTAGPEQASLFLSAYVLEKALSVDNLVVFGAVFAYFGVRPEYQHRVLYYGVLGAIVLRLAFVLLGTTALSWIGPPAELAFAAFVAWSALKVFSGGGDGAPDDIDHRTRWYSRWTQKVLPLYAGDEARGKFFVRMPVRSNWETTTALFATPLFLCLVSVEVTDVMFAFDSVPVVVAVARDPMIVYPAMILAILGLRSMYFVLAALRQSLVHLDKAVGVVLVLVAAKLAADALLDFRVDPLVGLGVVLGVLGVGVIASLLAPRAVGETS